MRLNLFKKQKPTATAPVKLEGFQWTGKRSHALIGPLFIYFEEKYRPKRLTSAKIQAVINHHVALRVFARYLGRPAEIADLTEKHLRGFSEHRVHTVARNTARRDLDCLLAVARFAFERDDLATMPKFHSREIPEPVAIEERGQQ